MAKTADEIREDYLKKLEDISSLSREEARRELIKEVEQDAAGDIAKIIKETEDTAKATALHRSQEIVVDAMQHGALDYIAEYTVSAMRIDSEDVKGRII